MITINEDNISTNKKELKIKSGTINISTKTNTLKLSKDLLAKKKNISEIAKIRNITEKKIALFIVFLLSILFDLYKLMGDHTFLFSFPSSLTKASS